MKFTGGRHFINFLPDYLYKATATKQLTDAGVKKIDEKLLDVLVGRMKTMIDNKDSTLVATSDAKELESVRKNFVVKKLEMKDKDKGNAAINVVATKMKGVKQKNRAAFYYLVQQELN